MMMDLHCSIKNCEVATEKNNCQHLLSSYLEDLLQRKLNREFDHVDTFLKYPSDKCDVYLDIEECVKFEFEKIRLCFIKLIAESVKSTLGLTKKELDLTLYFLKYNICEKMEYVPFIKKILKRINENYFSLTRQFKINKKRLKYEEEHQTSDESFQEFFKSHTKEQSQILEQLNNYNNFCSELLCFLGSCINISAVHIQKQSSLQIISLMQDILNIEIYKEISNDLYKIIYECLLVNSYESIKEMCFKILTRSNKDSLKGKGYRCTLLALKLANSMRPIDVITSSYILKLAMLSSDFNEEINNFEIIKRNELVLQSKAKEALSVLMILIDELETQLQIADKSIVLAASKYSIFGILFSIRSVLKTVNLKKVSEEDIWRKVIQELILKCFRLSKAASEIVNNSSPEGHLPMDLDPKHLQEFLLNDDDLEVTPQMVLLCSWRSIKEVSLLFGTLTASAPILTGNKKGLISEKEVEEIGEHFVKLLCETKHRGAFEQAHVGFTMLCSRLWRYQEGNIKNLPKIWLRKLIVEISGLSHSNTKLCATRRSAGVPFMMQAIITSEVDRKKDLKSLTLHSVMKILIGLSQFRENEFSIDKVKNLIIQTELFQSEKIKEFECTNDEKLGSLTEIKSHALNIMRILVKNAQLGELIQEYIADCVISAVRSYDGNCWAERNAATLLFGALVTRIFGVQRTKDHIQLTHHNKLTGNKFFDMYPKLLNFMLEELQNFTSNNCVSMKPAVQSILLILSRLCPSECLKNSDSEWKMDEFIKLISHCGKSRVHKTRELAARALVQFVVGKNVNVLLSKLILAVLSDLSSFNAAHGYCLQLIEILTAVSFTSFKNLTDEFIEFIDCANRKVLSNLEISSTEPACFALAAACFVIMDLIFTEKNLYLNEMFFRKMEIYRELHIMKTVERHLTGHCLRQLPGRHNYEQTIFTFYAKYSVKSFELEILQDIISHDNEGVQTKCLSSINYSLSKLKKDNSTCNYFVEYVMESINLENPELRLEVHLFLKSILLESKHSAEPDALYIKIINWTMNKMNENLQTARGYFDLLSAIYFILNNKKDLLTNDDAESVFKNIYGSIVYYSWMGNACLDCRIEICNIIYQMNPILWTPENTGYIYHWWTSILHLLIDDDDYIRENMAKMLCNIQKTNMNYSVCTRAALKLFFEIFAETVCQMYPYVATIMLFSWGTNLMLNEDFEMDDSDIFTKSSNYKYLDFEMIADHCIDCIKKYCKYERINGVVNYRQMYEKYASNLELPFRSFDKLFNLYENYPVISDDIENLLDPNYDKKLFHSRIFLKFGNL